MERLLAPCDRCHRHVRVDAPACPFCAVPRAPGAAAVVAVALGAALLGQPASADPIPPRLQSDHAPAAGYGAPPSPWPLGPGLGPQAPVERPLERPHEHALPAVPGAEVTVGAVTVRGALDLAAMRASIAPRAGLFQRCAALPDDGPMEVRATLTPRGQLQGLRLGAMSPRMQACVRVALRAVAWPRPRSPVAITVNVRRAAPGRPPEPPRASACGASPAGCRGSSCGPGMACVHTGRCRPSSCGCDATTGQWTCTSDCGGGECVPTRERAGGG